MIEPNLSNNTLSIVIPAYNEEDSLKANMPSLLAFCKINSYQLIIVNDGSKDGTQQVLENYASSDILTILKNKLNKGYGGAIKTGIAQSNTKYVITIDADGQHNLEDVSRLHSEIISMDADMIIGSRKGLKSASFYRRMGKSFIRRLARFMMAFNVYDINSGMKIYNAEMAKKYLRLCPDGMAYSDIIALVFISQRHLVLESPISISHRTAGESTISTMTAVDTIKEILNIVILFNPMKIFFPIALVSIIAGLAWGLPLIYMGRGVSVGALLAFVVGLLFFFLGLIAEQLSLLRKSNIIV